MSKLVLHVAAAVLLLIMLSGSMLGYLAGHTGTLDLPDLVITEFSTEPTESGGFRVFMTAANRGTGPSDQCTVLFLDEYDIVSGNTSTIASLTLPPLDGGESSSLENEWDPEIADIHRLWAVIDPSSSVEESNAGNNAASLFLQFPRVAEVRSDIGGGSESNEFGTYLAGIPLEVPVHTRFDMEGDPHHFRVYYQDDNGSSIFVPYVGDSDFFTLLNVGELHPGRNRMTVNSSYARVPLDPYDFFLNVREAPRWMNGLDMVDMHYDHGTGCYNTTGYIDVPALSGNFPVNGTSHVSSFKAFQGDRDLMIRAWTGLDGSSIIDILASFELEIGGAILHLSFTNRTVIFDPWGNESVTIEGLSTLPDVSLFPAGIEIVDEAMDGRKIPVVASPVISGEISFDMDVELNSEEGPITSGSISLNIGGSTNSLITGSIPGFDRPVIQATTETTWTSSHTLDAKGVWSSRGSLTIGSSTLTRDTGLIVSWGAEPWEIQEGEIGHDIAITPDGGTADIMISKGAGHKNVLSADINGTEYQIYSDNRYISSPNIVFLRNSTPVAVWTRALEWSNDTAARVSSLRTTVSVGESGGGFTGNVRDIDNMGVSEFHPDLASNGDDMAAAVWTADMDSNMLTLMDQEVMVSFLTNGSWSPPERITENSLWDDFPKVVFDDESNLWAAWLSDGGRGQVAVWERAREQWSVPMTLNGGDSSHETSAIEITSDATGTPVVATIFRDKSINSSWKVSVTTLGEWPVEQDNALTVAEFDEPVDDISLKRGPDGRMALAWRTYGDGDGELWMSIISHENDTLSCTRPLPLTNDSIGQYHPLLMPLSGGEMLFSRVRAYMRPAVDPPGELYDIVDLSNGAMITGADHELLGDYNRWESLKIGVTVRNIGLSPKGRVYVNLDRIARDPFTGNLSQVSIGSKLVTFTSLEENIRIEFTTTMVENQLSYRIWTVSGWGDPAAMVSSFILPMPVMGDPRIEEVNVMGEGEYGFERRFGVHIMNHGLVTVDPLRIEILREGDIQIPAYTGTWREPFGPRNLDQALKVNTTTVGLDPGQERDILMNATVSPGRNVFWIRLVEPDGGMTVSGPFRIDLFRAYSTYIEPYHRIITEGRSLPVEVFIEDTSEFPPCGSDCQPSNGTLVLNVEDGSGEMVLGFSVNVSLPDNGTRKRIHLELPTTDLEPGMYEITFHLAWTSEITGEVSRIKGDGVELSVMPGTHLSISRIETLDQGFSGKIFRVKIRNDSNRTAPVVRVVLFNGPIRDMVILSEGMGITVGPGETYDIDLEFSFQEGTYYLSIGIFTERPDSASIPWDQVQRDATSFEYRENATARETGTNEKVDMQEVKDSALIGSAAVLLVLTAAALFRRRKGGDDRKKQ